MAKKTLKKRRPGHDAITQIKNSQEAKHEYKMLLAKAQNYICPLCKRDFSDDESKSLHLDHNHKNGKVRACLCGGCNRAEGKIAGIIRRFLSKVEIDFEEFIKNMVKYWDYHDRHPSNVLHPDHKTPFDKKAKASAKAKKRRENAKKQKDQKAGPAKRRRKKNR